MATIRDLITAAMHTDFNLDDEIVQIHAWPDSSDVSIETVQGNIAIIEEEGARVSAYRAANPTLSDI
jgi:hypothetical protein